VALLALGHDLEPEDRLLGDLDHRAVGDARVGDDDEIILLEDIAVLLEEILDAVLAPGLLVGDKEIFGCEYTFGAAYFPLFGPIGRHVNSR
jgi:hypothetical protein